ncbi:MAG: M60 family metallopeptidase [Ruminococcus sp.]|nr:M60 family metallopeptidase [Ruminococcus sp.]
MKRKVAFLLALSMVCSFPQAICAGAALSDIGGSLGNADSTSVLSADSPGIMELNADSLQEKADTGESEVSGNVGRVEVDISLAILIDNDIDFTLKLSSADGYSKENIVKSSDVHDGKIVFSGLADGDYNLTVTAPGFVAFSQNITVAQKMYTLKLTAGFCKGYTYDVGEVHPGVLMIGDVNGDNIIDDEDKNAIIDAIDGIAVPEKFTTDLNNDGETNLLDLSFFATSYNEEKDTTAAVEEFISPDVIHAETLNGTILEGDVEKMLAGDEEISLYPAKSGAVSKDNPISIGFDLIKDGEAAMMDGVTFETGTSNPVDEAFIDVAYVDEDGEEHTVSVPVKSDVHYLLKESDVYAEIDEHGSIKLHLGSQVAVKKVTLTITAMQKNSNNLAEISKVEFVNGMENRIPEPAMDIPENFKTNAGSERFDLSWSPCMNVTGYEVKIEQGGKTELIMTSTNSLSVTRFNNNDVKNYAVYKVSVQAVNGTWKSGYCDSVDVIPQPNKAPDKPDNVKASGIYKGITVSWANMDDTQSYSVFYKLRGSEDDFIEIPDVKGTSVTINDLEVTKEYEAYVIGHNDLGDSPESLHAVAKTTDLSAPEMPKYNVINRDEKGNPGTAHIVDVTRFGGEMVESPLDDGLENTAWGAVDGDPFSYYSKGTWDDGGFNGIGNNGLTYTFDKDYTLDTIAIFTMQDISYTNMRCWDSEGNLVYILNDGYANLASRKTDKNGTPYYILKLPHAVTANKVQISLARYLASPITVAETYFYHYDTLMDEIMDLYVDDLHTVLKDGVTHRTIENLRKKVNTPDEYGEANPNAEALLRELETAERILNAESISSPVAIHNGITTNDPGRGFSGINAWQPLGVSIGSGENVTIYVGSDKKKTGDSTNLRLVVTQYHSESGNIVLDGANLKVGANDFTLTKSSGAGFESGGALYIQYQGDANASEKYSVRVTGGSEVPFLDLYKVTDEEERMERTVEYLNKLDEYVPQIEKLHNENHKGSENMNLDYDYDKYNCILEASDILLDTMMYSLPAQKILEGAGKGTVEERAETVLKSMEATEEMMYLFYQHKGLNSSAKDAINQIPKGHLNIRYQRMFSGAFMYASGNHIGIEWDSAPPMMQGTPIVADEDGKYISGGYYGWGISHEIGHDINQGAYAVPEITNNYFSQLAQSQDKNNGMRFQYENIYSKVTSGTKGDCSNIATQLGMYWQLHLAYDTNALNFKTYEDYNEQLKNIFYARVDTYARNPKAAPAPNGIALEVNGDSNQNLMRLACAAAEKNVLEFFERWGKSPDKDTIAYASQFEKETRAIFFANDDSRVYALKGKGSVLAPPETETEPSEEVVTTASSVADSTESTTTTTTTAPLVSAIDNVSVAVNKSSANKVELEFTPSDIIPAEDILGYEVVRCTISGGQVEEMPVGFAQGSTFTDTISTLNNRAVFYKVTLIDQYLYRSAVYETKMVKIEHDGSFEKSNWTISATGLKSDAVVVDDDKFEGLLPCEKEENNPAKLAIDNDLDTVYAPKVEDDKAEIVIDFHKTLTATGFKYTAGDGGSVSDYQIYVLDEDNEWLLTAEGTFKGSETVYFSNDDGKYISTYSTSSVKLVISGQTGNTVSISELDVLGVTGDNVDFRRTDGEEVSAVIGILGEDYEYDKENGSVIPKDSLVFSGSYKGNPAYNVVILYDGDGNIVGGFDADNNLKSQQIILADVPDGKNITDVSDGTWIYWIEPEDIKGMTVPETVRVELYRVNNALTNEGQRMVSDSLFEEVPAKDSLPTITLGE